MLSRQYIALIQPQTRQPNAQRAVIYPGKLSPVSRILLLYMIRCGLLGAHARKLYPSTLR